MKTTGLCRTLLEDCRTHKLNIIFSLLMGRLAGVVPVSCFCFSVLLTFTLSGGLSVDCSSGQFTCSGRLGVLQFCYSVPWCPVVFRHTVS